MRSTIKIILFCMCIAILFQESFQFFFKKKSKTKENDDGNSKQADKGGNNPFWKRIDKKQEKVEENEETAMTPTTEKSLPTGPSFEEDSNTDLHNTTPIPQEEEGDGPACEPKSDDLLAKINELRTSLEGKIPENSDVTGYSKDDNYLLRWLTACSMDVNDCNSKITAHIKWREATKVDEIENEDFGEIPNLFKFFLGGQDKDGRPVAEWWLHDAEIDQMIQNTDIGILKLARWLISVLEGITRNLYETNINKKKCVTQAVLLVDSHSLDANKHACQNCQKLFAVFAQTFEMQYPFLFKNLHFINTENAPFMQILRVMASQFKQKQQTLASFKLYKTDEEWKPVLEELIDATQRSEKFGGTMNA